MIYLYVIYMHHDIGPEHQQRDGEGAEVLPARLLPRDEHDALRGEEKAAPAAAKEGSSG